MSMSPEELGRRAADLNAQRAADRARQERDEMTRAAQLEAELRAKRAPVRAYLSSLVTHLTNSRVQPLPLFDEEHRSGTQPTEKFWIRHPSSETNYYTTYYRVYTPLGSAYQLTHRRERDRPGLPPNPHPGEGLVVTPDLRVYYTRGPYAKGRFYIQKSAESEAAASLYGYFTDREAPDLATLHSEIENIVVHAAAAYERGDFPPVPRV